MGLQQQRQRKNFLDSKHESVSRVFSDARLFAATDYTVLITGETGTGKEVLADYIHTHSLRASSVYLKINCAAFPETLLESNLFGYERGAFTGALSRTPGLFERAEGGTVLLDEIGELPLSLQAKFLRFLQDKTFYRVGGTEEIRCDVRIIAASNRNLSSGVDSGLFRADVLFRLRSFSLELPPVRHRLLDLPDLCATMLPARVVTSEAIKLLSSYSWPGNLRELHGVLSRAALHTPDGDLGEEAFAFFKENFGEFESVVMFEDLNLERAKRVLVSRALKISKYNQKSAASLLGVTPRVLNYLISKYRITHHAWRRNV